MLQAEKGFAEVARASRPLWHGHPFATLIPGSTRALLRPTLGMDRPLFPVVEEGLLPAGAGRARHSGRDARVTPLSLPKTLANGGSLSLGLRIKFLILHFPGLIGACEFFQRTVRPFQDILACRRWRFQVDKRGVS